MSPDANRIIGELQRRITELNAIRVRVVDERDELRRENVKLRRRLEAAEQRAGYLANRPSLSAAHDGR